MTRSNPLTSCYGGFLLLCMVCFLLCTTERAWSQENRSLDVGTMLYTTNEAFSADDLEWPRKEDVPFVDDARRVDMLENYGLIIGVLRTWTDPTGVPQDVQVAQVAEDKFVDTEVVTPPVEGAFQRTYRSPYPDRILDRQNWADEQAQNDPVDPSLPADVQIYNHLTTWTGIDIERWTYAFAHDDYDDFVILEHLFTNTSQESLSDVYFGITAQTSAYARYPADIWGTYYGVTYDDYVAGDESADYIRTWASWDADQTSASPGIDTRAKPGEVWGSFQEPQFVGLVVLHADESAGSERDDPSQPWKAGWSGRDFAPDLNVNSHVDIYDYLAAGWDPYNPPYAVTVDGDKEVVPDGTGPYRVLQPGLAINNNTSFDPLLEQEKTALLSFGPYTLEPGQDVRIVTAFAAGQIPPRLAIDAGRAYENGQPQQRTAPLPYDVENPFTGELLAQQGTMLDRATKNEILDLGLSYMLVSALTAVRIWKDGSVRSGEGSFNVRMAPAAPSLYGSSEPGQIRLRWENEATNQTVVGWRVYREYKRPSGLDMPTDTTFVLLTELPASQTEYLDTDVTQGEDHYYYVTAVNEQGVESSAYLNRTGLAEESREEEALTPGRSTSVERDGIPEVYALEQNYPNPFNPATTIAYDVAEPSDVRLVVHDLLGREVAVLADAQQTSGRYEVTFDASGLASGVYLYTLRAGDFTQTKRLVLLK